MLIDTKHGEMAMKGTENQNFGADTNNTVSETNSTSKLFEAAYQANIIDMKGLSEGPKNPDLLKDLRDKSRSGPSPSGKEPGGKPIGG